MASVIVAQDYTVAAGQSLVFTDEYAFVIQDLTNTRPTASLTIAGSVSVVATPANTIQSLGVVHLGASFFADSRFWVQSGGSLSVSSVGGGGQALGFHAGNTWAADFRNDGTVTVVAADLAVAVDVTEPTSFHFDNTGQISASGVTANAVRMLGGGHFYNSSTGVITATATTPGAGVRDNTIGVLLYGHSFDFHNDGAIIVKDGGAERRSVGVYLDGGGSGSNFVFVNSGRIEADTAIYAYDQGTTARKTLTNTSTGVLVGDIVTNYSVHYTLNNSGSIVGNVYLSFGNDTYSGAAGSVTGEVHGGAGTNVLTGGSAKETVSYSDATLGVNVNLALTGAQATNWSTDTLAGFENLTGSEFNDSLTGDAGANILSGLAGDDLLVGGGGDDRLDGGQGSDTADYSGAAFRVTVNLSVAASQSTGGAGVDTLISIENLTGSAYDDVLIGAAGVNALYGGQGDDRLDGGAGDDRLDGGAGNDTASYLETTAGVTVSLALQGAAQATGGAGSDTLVSIENLTGSAFADTLTGDAGVNVLIGAGGNDTLDGAAGADRLYGGAGDDTYHVNTHGDLVFEFAGEGADTVIATGDFYLYDNIETLELASSAGDIFGVGNSLDNRITGNAGNNLILGGGGNDSIHGGAGDDRIYGEAGDDVLYDGAGDDLIVGGAGKDVLNGGAGNDRLYGDDGNDGLTGETGSDWLVGGAGNDLLNGQLNDAGERDLLFGGAGDDSYVVDANDLTFEEAGGGTDTVIAIVPGGGYYLYANIENLGLGAGTTFGVGNELDNSISGNYGDNWLLGGAGNDTLEGGPGGNDVFFGQDGADTFVFAPLLSKFDVGIGADVIADFAVGVDKVKLAGIYSSFAEVQSHMVQNGTDSAIDLGNGDLVVFQHVAMSAFTANDFLF